MRAGITPVVAIAILMGMTVVAAGGAYAFFTATTQEAFGDATTRLDTATTVRQFDCSDTTVTVGLSNTGDRELVATNATAYLYREGELLGTTEIDLSGENVLQPGGFSQLEFPFTTYLEPGRGYQVEVDFTDTDYTLERGCTGETGDMLGYWNFDTLGARTVQGATPDSDGTFRGMDLNGTVNGWAHNGTLGSSAGSDSSDPSWVACETGTCLDFDGSGDYATAPGVGTAMNGSNAFTIAYRINYDELDDYAVAYGRRNYDGGSQASFWTEPYRDGIEGVSIQIRDATGSTHQLNSGRILDEPGRWYHITYTWDGRYLRAYLDGDLVGTHDTGGVTVNLPVDHYIGSYNAGGNIVNATMDDVQLYSRNLSVVEIRDIATGGAPKSGIIAYYPFEEGSGQTAWNNAFRSPGVRGDGMRFDGTDDVVTVPDSPELDITGELTVTAWVNRAAQAPQYPTIVQKGSRKYDFYLRSTDEVAFYCDSCSLHQTSGADIPAGQWTHVAMVYDDGADSVRLYVNGQEELDATESGSIGTDNGPLRIGDGPDQFNGSLDDVRIYRRALSQQEVQNDMDGEPPARNIAAYYPMDGPEGRTVWNGAFREQGPNGGVIRFAAGNRFVEVPYASWMDITDEITMAAWAKHDGDPDIDGNNNWRGIFSRDSAPYRLLLEDQGAFSGSVYIGSRQKTDAPTGVFSPDTWHHVVYTYDGSTGNATIWVDGALAVTETEATGTFDTTTSHLVISGAGTTWNGTLDEIRLYDTVLPQDRVTALYEATR